ncbi:MAG: hypothetical protein ACI3YI_06580 [Bacteroidaceae bacterium]
MRLALVINNQKLPLTQMMESLVLGLRLTFLQNYSLSVEYFYHINPLVGVGGIAVYTHGKRDMFYGNELQGKMKTNYYTFLPAVKFSWLRKKNWGLYSKAGLGVSVRYQKWNWYEVSHTNDSDTDFILNFQGTPIGVEYGNQYYWGVLELGMGEQGIVNAGIRIKM